MNIRGHHTESYKGFRKYGASWRLNTGGEGGGGGGPVSKKVLTTPPAIAVLNILGIAHTQKQLESNYIIDISWRVIILCTPALALQGFQGMEKNMETTRV